MGVSVIGGADGPTAIFIAGRVGDVWPLFLLFIVLLVIGVIWFLYRPKESRIEIDDTYMDYVVFGRGKKTLLLIPGLTLRNVKGSALPLALMYRVFAKEYRVYVFDKKAVVPEGYTVREIAEDIAKAMGILGIKKADVFGISQGGMAAQYLAIEHAELVHKLVLGVTAARTNSVMEACIQKWVAFSEDNNFKGIVEDMLKNMYSEAYVEKYRWMFPLLTKLSKPKDMKRFIILAKACLTCDSYKELDKIICPVFVIGGRQDRIVSGEASEEIADKLGCRIYMYEDLGHSAYEEAPDFNKRVYKFLGNQ